MGLEDLTKDIEEEVNSLEEDEVKEHIDRVVLLSKILVNIDGETEELADELQAVKRRVNTLERKVEQISNEDSETGFLEGEESEQESGGDFSWG